MIRNPLFIIGLILVLLPIAIKTFIEIRPLPLSDSNDPLQYFVRKFDFSIAHSELSQSLHKPHLIHYKSFINLRSVNNPLDFPRGSIKHTIVAPRSISSGISLTLNITILHIIRTIIPTTWSLI
jgi:hypothetical protein